MIQNSQQLQQPILQQLSCPYCYQNSNINVNVPTRQHSFDKEVNCNICGSSFYIFACKCGLYHVQKEPFVQGKTYDCPNPSNCPIKKIQLIKCANPQCMSINMYTGEYVMGKTFICAGCKQNLQQVNCPRCYNNIFYVLSQGTQYIEGQQIKCYTCSQSFEHVNCVNCKIPRFSAKEKFTKDEVKQCNKCGQEQVKLHCPHCSRQYYQQGFPYQFYRCTQCNKHTQFYYCPQGNCGKMNHICQDYKGTETGFFKCKHCSHKYVLFSCINCKKPMTKEFQKNKQYKADVITTQCNTCQTKQLAISCIKCENGYGVPDLTRTEWTCHCGQNIKIQQEAEVLPTMQLNKVESQDNDKYLCKICQDNTATYIMEKCFHLVACEECVDLLQNKCPMCRQEGASRKMYI